MGRFVRTLAVLAGTVLLPAAVFAQGSINTLVPNFAYRAAMSYVTGTHNVKIGFNRTHGFLNAYTYATNPVSYRFNNGVPNQITLRATPYTARSHQDNDLGLFAQDRWTIDRLTVNLALRYDYFGTSFPEQRIGPGPLVPTRNLTFPAQDNLAWHDLTYRTGLSYDLRGNGKTALKATVNKYLRGQTLNTLGSSPNPVNALVTLTNRSWNDANRNFVPECNLTIPDANGECGPMANRNFGTPVPGATYDEDLLTGWGHRERNWEFSAGVQHEVLPRVEVQVAGTFRSTPGSDINANFNASNVFLAANSTLGRALSGGAANITVGLLDPNTVYLDRRNELDVRFGKVVCVGRARSVISLDLYNALNTDALISVNQNFGAWLRPTEILNARLAKISVQFDF